MHLNPRTGLWEQDDNDYIPPTATDDLPDKPMGDPLDEEPSPHDPNARTYEPAKLNCKCVLSIRLENHGEYLKWQKYSGSYRKWEFIHEYPAFMRAEYDLNTAAEVEEMAKKVVQLLQMGFNVYSAQWKLEEVKEGRLTSESPFAKNSTP